VPSPHVPSRPPSAPSRAQSNSRERPEYPPRRVSFTGHKRSRSAARGRRSPVRGPGKVPREFPSRRSPCPARGGGPDSRGDNVPERAPLRAPSPRAVTVASPRECGGSRTGSPVHPAGLSGPASPGRGDALGRPSAVGVSPRPLRGRSPASSSSLQVRGGGVQGIAPARVSQLLGWGGVRFPGCPG